jgi:hypothetical protein
LEKIHPSIDLKIFDDPSRKNTPTTTKDYLEQRKIIKTRHSGKSRNLESFEIKEIPASAGMTIRVFRGGHKLF